MIDDVTGQYKAGLPWPREFKADYTHANAYMCWQNAALWLHQAASGAIPSGGQWPVDTVHSNNDYTEAERPGAND